MIRALILLVLFASGQVLSGPVNGKAHRVVLSPEPLNHTISGSSESGGGVSLVLDDGTRDISIGFEGGGQFLWLNRFTPDPSEFPFTLDEVQILFGAGTGVSIGETVDIYLYEDTDGDGDPGTGALFREALRGQVVQAVDDVTWSVYSAPFVVFNGPGDVLVAVVNRTAGVDPGDLPAALDESSSNMRSWLGTYGGNPPDPPTLPAPFVWTLIDNIGSAGNWMVRAFGEAGVITPGIGFAPDSMTFAVAPGESDSLTMTLANTATDTLHFFLSDESAVNRAPGTGDGHMAGDAPWLAEHPSSGIIAPGGTTDAQIIVDGAGLATGDYMANVIITSDDPFHPDTTMPVFLHVGGAPEIVLSTDTLLFPLPVLVNDSDTLALSVVNAGSVDLHVASVVSSNTVFTASPTSFSVNPGDSVSVEVVFAPDSAGIHSGMLTLTSDDPDDPTVSIFTEGTGITAPSINLDPDSITVTLGEGDSVDVSVTIMNLGGSPLTWAASITPPAAPDRRVRETKAGGTSVRNDICTATDPSRVHLLPRVVRGTTTVPSLLFDNGPLINSPGTGVGGADESVLQNISLGMSTFGFAHQPSTNSRVADDFVVTGNGWQVDSITLYAYQTFSDTLTTINTVNYRIWNGPPGSPSGSVVFGDTATNRLIGSTWSRSYRVSESTSGMDTERPVMRNVVAAGVFLQPGSYWLDWQTGGTLGSGPWAPPVTITGESSTGNGLLYVGSWIDAVDIGQQGFPFLLQGSIVGDFVTLLPPSSGIIEPGGEATMMIRLRATAPDTILAATLLIQSDDPENPSAEVPIIVHVQGVVAVGDPEETPSSFTLSQNYPNPFNPETVVRFSLPTKSFVSLRVFDILGNMVVTLDEKEEPPGIHSVTWNGRNGAGISVASGVYICSIEAHSLEGGPVLRQHVRMVLLK